MRAVLLALLMINAGFAIARAQVLPEPEFDNIALQLAAMRTLDDAHQRWAALREQYPDLLSQREPYFEAVKSNIEGLPIYRVRLRFNDFCQADRLCDELRAQGGPCFLATTPSIFALEFTAVHCR